MTTMIQNQANETTDTILTVLGISGDDEQRNELSKVVEQAIINVTLDLQNQSTGSGLSRLLENGSGKEEFHPARSILIANLSSLR